VSVTPDRILHVAAPYVSGFRLPDADLNRVGGDAIGHEYDRNLASAQQAPGQAHVHLVKSGIGALRAGIQDLHSHAADGDANRTQ